MALTVRTNGSGPSNIVSASWWNDYYNLLTGAMTDQQVKIAFLPGTLGGVALTVVGNANNDVVLEVQNNGTPVWMVGYDGTVWQGGAFTNVGNVGAYSAAGSVGVPVVVGAQTAQHFTVTTDNWLGWPVNPSGVYRCSAFMLINNGGAATITAYVKYTDPYTSTVVTKYFTIYGTSTALNAAATGNGQFALVPIVFSAKSGTNIEVHFQDSTNTPSDYFDYNLEYLA